MNLTLNITTPLLIIGAALPRTATTSIASALERLGYKVFHFTTMTKPFHPIWEDICDADTQQDKQQYDLAFGRFVQQLSDEGFNATLDQPSCFVYEQLMEIYPDAKVLQTQRDAGSWARSMVEMGYSMDMYFWQPPFTSSWNVTKGPYGYWHKKQMGYRDEEIHPHGVPKNSNPYNKLERKSSISMASAKVAYHRYHHQVQEKVPSERLVPYHPKQGWGPLCKQFLPSNETCPEGPFPHVNTNNDGFLLDARRKFSARVHLHKIHPSLSNQKWLVNSVVFIMKRRRKAINAIRRIFAKGNFKQTN
ncbi:expressed unknown protein [Seminavis robusta]|uniref:Uncharacterized protein n=1 Tax=Seminavis robusta TaxID=568900 RepID=A0A9N8F1G9_9STRA|nr:expressed unknown protein [Seminavis robusta]|eukprot:Sro2277_g321730.1 n/a (305) ;mRNA; r:11531-12445